MKRIAWIALWTATACIAFAVGTRTAKISESERDREQHPEKIQAADSQPRPILADAARLDELRTALADREDRIRELEAELEEVRAKLPPPLSAEEEKRKKEQEERHERSEHRRARYEKSKELREKILQRRDKALRAQGLEELAALLRSDDAEEVLLGLTALPSIRTIPCDRERFKPQVFTALGHEEPEIRRAAFVCLYTVCSREEQLDMALSLVNDPSPEIRRMATERIAGMRGSDQEAAVTLALRSLLQDNDKQIKLQAMYSLAMRSEYTEEMENVAIELSKDPEYADEMREWFARGVTISKEVAQRLVEMYDEGSTGYPRLLWAGRQLSDDAKPIATDFCLRIVRDSLQHYDRWQALERLRSIGDIWVLPELEEIARSVDAEGIEEELARTIENLQKRAKGQR